MKERLNTDDEAAVRREIEASDEAQGAIMRRHFGIDWRESEHYDLSLNTARVSVDECVEEVMSLVKDPVFQETEASVAKFRNLALVARVRAALRADPRTVKMNMGIVADMGKVMLSGELERFQEPIDAEEVAAKVNGVTEVVNRLRYATPKRML